jgi:adenosylmethionine-8-amino-7-oxononanoate aminotransferase
VEVAVKMALQYWQLKGRPGKTRFVSLVNAYHGDTVGAVSLGGVDLFHRRFGPLLFPTFKAGAPYCYRCFLGKTFPDCRLACLGEVESILKKHRHEIAAVAVEPVVQGAAGMIVWPKGYLSGIRRLCTRYGVLMLADEVLTGFGRTGKLFACQTENVTPDLMAVAKGLTGGYLPLAATLTTREIYDAFLGEYAEFKTFFHGHSYTGNQLGCAAALANLDVFEKEGVLKKTSARIRQMRAGLRPLRDHPRVGDIRQAGMIAGIELVKDRRTREPYAPKERIGHRVARAALERGMIIRPLGHIIVLMPPLSTGEAVLNKMIRILDASIREATET